MMEFFETCVKEAEKAYNNNEVPIGAVVVFNNKIISMAHNNRESSNDVTGHAEIIAIREAAKIIGDWRLEQCDLYVTLEPCAMCSEVIKESRINNVFFLIKKDDFKHSFNKTSFNCVDDKSFQQLISIYKTKLSTFFQINCNR